LSYVPESRSLNVRFALGLSIAVRSVAGLLARGP